MTPSEPTPHQAWTVARVLRRVVGMMLLSAIMFAILWITVFSAVKSALVAVGIGGVLAMAGSMSDVVETVLEAISSAVLGILSAIAAFLGAIFSFFGD